MKLSPGKYQWVDRGIWARGTAKGVVYGISYQFRGRRRLETVGPSITLARSALAARKGEIAQGRFRLESTRRLPQFPDFLERYLSDYSRPNKRSNARDEGIARHLIGFFGPARLDQITAWNIERYRAARIEGGTSQATTNRELALLKHVLAMSVRWGELSENPARDVKLARVQERPFRVLSYDEERRLLAVCADHLKPVVVLALNTGLRRGELLALAWGDVDLPAKQLTVRRSKSGKVRTIPLNEAAFAALGDKGEGAIFRYQGEPIGTIAAAFRNAVRRSGLPHVRFHDLRHTFITRLVLSGADLATVRELAGHASFAMTLRYSHPSPENRREAVARLDATAAIVQPAQLLGRKRDRRLYGK